MLAPRLAEVLLAFAVPDLAVLDLAALPFLAAVLRPAAGFGLAGAAVRAGAAGLATGIVFAAAVSDLAAVVMALVALFIACMAVNIVLADVVALLAAAVILVAAEVTLVAAEDTVRAAVMAAGAFLVPAERVVFGLVLELVFGRAAVFFTALLLADLPRAGLAVLRRAAARVVCAGTELPPS
ncbi:MAG: hypothetical protein ACLQI7_05290 [Streptosporangiaceae bacterium]